MITCRNFRDHVTDSLMRRATKLGLPTLSPEYAKHRDSCPNCQSGATLKMSEAELDQQEADQLAAIVYCDDTSLHYLGYLGQDLDGSQMLVLYPWAMSPNDIEVGHDAGLPPGRLDVVGSHTVDNHRVTLIVKGDDIDPWLAWLRQQPDEICESEASAGRIEFRAI